MKIVTEMYAKEVVVLCPHCHEEQDGFVSNPAGGVFECEHCTQTYKVHTEADIEHR
jgi:ribosomal protein L37AE/L43A